MNTINNIKKIEIMMIVILDRRNNTCIHHKWIVFDTPSARILVKELHEIMRDSL
jgi:hypothetical protein